MAVDSSFCTQLINFRPNPNELHMPIKGKWSYFDSLEVITT